MIVFPNAKINIGLKIVSKRSDGYHNLETIFYPVKLTDALEMVESKKTELSVTGIQLDNPLTDNLVLKAYRLLKDDFNLPPVKFHLHKTIPFGAGLGGGSSDAAFTLNMLNDYFELGLSVNELAGYARRLGADCLFFLTNKPVLATGIGDFFQSISLNLSSYKIVIVKPPFGVSTPEAYKNVTLSKPHFSLNKLNAIPVEEWKKFVENDFEKTVFKKYPPVEEIKNELYRMGAVFASLSGSGSAVYGIFCRLPIDFDQFQKKGFFVYR
ncbi:MAG: 4-(cytidine 5'-diphospho)-2-C-methyl-D-erythritol kinase [Prolixibacteraceae bacterium]|nr:4-(cytidine 5'-diphospho)-2-C-methyl-D-erythritol kinase [Prolixibacteraceae bacterium]